jgi:hypothetical protein
MADPTPPDATDPHATDPHATDPHATDPHATDPDATDPDATDPDATAAVDPADEAVIEPEPVVDFSRTARRLRLVLTTIASAAVVAWLVIGFAGDGVEPRLLAELLGLGLLLAFAVEVVVVGGAAVRGMLRAGERGDRLASADVALLPPQLTRRRRR